MKTRYLIFSGCLFFCCIAGILMMGGCKKATELQPAIYVTGTRNTPGVNFTVSQTGNAFAISATASSVVPANTTVSFEIDPSLVAQYSEKTGLTYAALPAGSYSLSSASVTIPAGSNVSNQVNVVINSFENIQAGVQYVLPISITNTSGSFPVLEPNRTLYAIVTRPVITPAVDMNGRGNGFSVDMTTNSDHLRNITQFSLECRFLFHSYNGRTTNLGYQGLMGNYPVGYLYMSLQDGLLFAINAIRIPSGLDGLPTLETWHHAASVYDNGSISIYLDGVLVGTGQATGAVNLVDGGEANLPAGSLFRLGAPSANTGRLENCMDGSLSEVRLWSKALTQREILSNMCTVDIASPNLEAYWKCNEGTGNVLNDYTGHGHNATAAAGAFTWITGVQCPN